MNQPIMAEGRVIRVADPTNVQMGQVVALEGLDPSQQEKKLGEIRKGGHERDVHPYLPDHRPCQDVIWFVLFLAMTLAVLGCGYLVSGKLVKTVEHSKDTNVEGVDFPSEQAMLPAVLAGVLASTATAFLYAVLAHRAPACVVWTSLLFGPCMTIAVGLGLCALPLFVPMESSLIFFIIGFVFIALGVCNLACVFCCWRDLIPFTISLTEVVADVIEHHPCLLFVGLLGSVLAFAWTISCFASFAAIYLENEEYMKDMMRVKQTKYVLTFGATFIYAWGAQVCYNICHVTCCGVYGRWYHCPPESPDAANPLGPSLLVATTTSLGSICFGSFLVAVIRALERVARAMKNDAREDGNPFMCVLACLLEAIINCIGDIMEYFNEWAYVQCAVRGTSFITSASITYALMTCANVQYIVADLLLDSLVSFGALLCGAVGAAVGAGVGYAMDGAVAASWGGVCGFFTGVTAGAAALSIISSGIKTVLACWADDPSPLQETHPEIHEEFENRIRAKW